MPSGIYQITNKLNGKRYIGSAVYLKRRQEEHLYHLCCGDHHNKHLQRAFDKYGKQSFEFSVLSHVNPEKLIEREQYYLDILSPEYNISKTAGSLLGYRASAETREKMSEAHKGKRNHNYGKRHSEETKRKISKALSGERNPNYGRCLSVETRRKISEAKKGTHHSSEHKRKLSETARGRIPSKKTRMRMSEAQKAYWGKVHAGEIER